MTVDLDKAKMIMLDLYDPDEILDVLNIDGAELLDAFEEKLLAYAKKEDLLASVDEVAYSDDNVTVLKNGGFEDYDEE